MRHRLAHLTTLAVAVNLLGPTWRGPRPEPPAPCPVSPVQAPARAPNAHHSASSRVRIPIEHEDGRVYVPVFAPGVAANAPAREGAGANAAAFLGWFILDTGASETILDAGLARTLGLAVKEMGSERGAGAASTPIGSAAGIPLCIGRVPFDPHELNVAPIDSVLGPSSGRPIVGIIGSQFFAEHSVAFDAPWRSMTVDEPARAWRASHANGAVTIPLDFTGGLPLVHGAITVRSGASRPRSDVTLLLDLGAKAPLLLSESLLARLGGEPALPAHVLASLGAGFGGETRYYFTRIGRFALGTPAALTRDSVVAGFSAASTLRSTRFDGLLGTPFLSRSDIRIDYRRRALSLAPSRALALASAREDFDMSGLFLVRDISNGAPRILVRRVIQASPAADVDIRPGDEIASVNGRSATALGVAAIREILRTRAGDPVRLIVRRDGHRSSRTLRLRPLV